MRSACAYFPTADSVAPAELARVIEDRGHESLFFCEHTHIPVARRSPYPWGDDLPGYYAETYDPFVACTAAATATTGLRIGTGVCLVAQRDPIVTAKEVASIDRLSGGRFEFGIGAGWNREEMENHGTVPRTRMRLMRERVEAMKAIWTDDEASYQGEFVSFGPLWSWPKPAQQPHPPILLGGDGPTVWDRVRDYADAWFPIYGDGLFDRLDELATWAGGSIEVQVSAMPADPAILEGLARRDVSRAIFLLTSGDRVLLERELDAWERAFAEFSGRTVARAG
jgi:probable F420-dependent oxidoreductase